MRRARVLIADEELKRNIVDAMTMEAIDRINRVEQEISEAEVAVVALNGAHQIEVARADNERTLEDLTAANTLAAEMHAQTLLIAQQENAQTLALNELNNSLTLENTRLEYAPHSPALSPWIPRREKTERCRRVVALC